MTAPIIIFAALLIGAAYVFYQIFGKGLKSLSHVEFIHTPPPPPGVYEEEKEYYRISHVVNEHYERGFKKFSTIGVLTDYTKKRLLAGGKILSIDIHENFLTFNLKPNGGNK